MENGLLMKKVELDLQTWVCKECGAWRGCMGPGAKLSPTAFLECTPCGKATQHNNHHSIRTYIIEVPVRPFQGA